VDEVGVVSAVIDCLNGLGVPYMIVGSLSTNAYGIERTTKDADFVVELGATPLTALMARLPPGFRLDPQVGFETVTSTTRYRLYVASPAFMVELFEVSDDPHDRERFARRVETVWAGRKAYLPRPEDVIVTKVRWSRGGKSRQKDVDDVRNVLAVQRDALDLAYIRSWADRHGTRERFEEILASVPPV
jgi:hypothetical protein